MVRPAAFLSSVILFLVSAFAWSLAAAPAPEGKTTEDRRAKEWREKLSKPVTLEKGIEANTSLRDALEFLSDRYDMTVLVDTQAFKADNMDAVEDIPVRLPKMIGVKLSTVLRLLLAHVNGTYLIRSDHLEVTTWKRARPEAWKAEDRSFAPTVDAEFERRPLDEALRALSDSSGINIVVDGRAGDKARATVTATLTNVPVDTAVLLLADMADLTSVPVDNVLYVTTKENAEQFQGRPGTQRKKQGEPEKLPAPSGPKSDSAGKPK